RAAAPKRRQGLGPHGHPRDALPPALPGRARVEPKPTDQPRGYQEAAETPGDRVATPGGPAPADPRRNPLAGRPRALGAAPAGVPAALGWRPARARPAARPRRALSPEWDGALRAVWRHPHGHDAAARKAARAFLRVRLPPQAGRHDLFEQPRDPP